MIYYYWSYDTDQYKRLLETDGAGSLETLY